MQWQWRSIRASVFGTVSWLKSTMSQRTFILTLNCCHHHLRMLCCWLYATTTYLCTLPHPAGTISIVSNLDFHMAYRSVLTWSELKLASHCFQYVLLDRSWRYICMSMCIVVARINTISFRWVDVFLSITECAPLVSHMLTICRFHLLPPVAHIDITAYCCKHCCWWW